MTTYGRYHTGRIGHLVLTFSRAHWRRPDLMPSHGPQSWPWWRLFGFGPCRLEVAPPSSGRRLWIYTRWGAVYFDAVIDRRTTS